MPLRYIKQTARVYIRYRRHHHFITHIVVIHIAIVVVLIINGAFGVNAVLGRECDHPPPSRLFVLAGRLGHLLFHGEGLRDHLRAGGGLGGVGVLCTVACVAAAPSAASTPFSISIITITIIIIIIGCISPSIIMNRLCNSFSSIVLSIVARYKKKKPTPRLKTSPL